MLWFQILVQTYFLNFFLNRFLFFRFLQEFEWASIIKMQPPNYHSVEARIKSFDGAKISCKKVVFWPHNEPTAMELANAGFYFTPKPDTQDSVTCYLCNITVEGWRKITTSPTDTHFKQNEKCPLANLNAEGENGNFIRLKTFFRFIESCNDTETLLNRGDSVWPHDGTDWISSSTAMASAGFYYAPNEIGEDYGLCPFCGLGLDGWELEDEPLKEHTLKSPRCRFVRSFQREPAVVKRAAEKRIKKNNTQMKSKRTTTSGFKHKKMKMVSKIPVMLDFKAKRQEITSKVLAPKSVNHNYLTQMEQIQDEMKIPRTKISLNIKRPLNTTKSGNYLLEHAPEPVPKLLQKDVSKPVLNSNIKQEAKPGVKSKKSPSTTQQVLESQSVSDQAISNSPGVLVEIPNLINSDSCRDESQLEPADCITDPDSIFDIVDSVKSIPLSDELKDLTVRQYLAYLADEAEAKVKEGLDKMIEKIREVSAKAVQSLENLPVKVET